MKRTTTTTVTTRTTTRTTTQPSLYREYGCGKWTVDRLDRYMQAGKKPQRISAKIPWQKYGNAVNSAKFKINAISDSLFISVQEINGQRVSTKDIQIHLTKLGMTKVTMADPVFNNCRNVNGIKLRNNWQDGTVIDNRDGSISIVIKECDKVVFDKDVHFSLSDDGKWLENNSDLIPKIKVML